MTYRAFVSSTFVDLKDHRAHVISSLRKAGFAVDPMEDWTADSDEPKKFSQDRLNGCDLCILLIAFRRGYVPDGETLSITQLEYEAALRLGIDILPFMLEENAPWFRNFDELEKDPEIKRWRGELQKRHGVQQFNLEPLSIDMTGPLTRWVEKKNRQGQVQAPTSGTPSNVPLKITWDIGKDGSPYPGLMHFTRKYARVFFGRDDEIREILYRLHKPEGRFIIISGDSGVGKSSVVDAGILPKLEDGALPDNDSCVSVRMVPGQGSQPFGALMTALGYFATRAGLRPDTIVEDLKRSPATLNQHLRNIIVGGNDGRTLVVFLDQMEELFTAQDVEESNKFLTAFYRAAQEKAVWVIATIRSDHLHFCHRHPEMLKVIRGPGHYPLGRVEGFMMLDMIVRPAERAGLTIPDRLVRRLIQDTGSELGNLPLLAFVLQRLFDARVDNALSEAVYETLGGVLGAIKDHVRTVEDTITKVVGSEPLDLLPRIFQSLLVMNVDGQPTRRRIPIVQFPEDLRTIVDILVKQRLLSTDGEGEASTVSVAHEKLFEAWLALARWIAENRDDLFVLRQAEIEAGEWQKHNFDSRYLWHVDRLKRLKDIVRRLSDRDINPHVVNYASPQDRLLKRLEDNSLSHQERLTIGNYLAALGDTQPGVGLKDGIPDIEWVNIPAGQVNLERVKGIFKAKAFRISRYPVTNIQFEAFIKADDGYSNEQWWRDIERGALALSNWPEDNCPRTDVSWYEAVAFCHWLSKRLGSTIRLPTEWEWQQAATGGYAKREYPWAGGWNPALCNSYESRVNRTTAVSVYPNGATLQAVLDMAGNVWEWCLNKYEKPGDRSTALVDKSGNGRVLRGGSWGSSAWNLRSSLRHWQDPKFHDYSIGFRLVQDIGRRSNSSNRSKRSRRDRGSRFRVQGFKTRADKSVNYFCG